jgi:2-iminobutanoate/2-iminopropanoate deaminase
MTRNPTPSGVRIAYRVELNERPPMRVLVSQTASPAGTRMAIVKAAGSSMAQVVSTTFILRYSEDFAGMNEEWLRWFPTDPPARQGAKDPLEVEGMRLSIAVIVEA